MISKVMFPFTRPFLFKVLPSSFLKRLSHFNNSLKTVENNCGFCTQQSAQRSIIEDESNLLKNTVAQRRRKDYQQPAPSIRSVLTNCKAGDTVRIKGWVKGLRKQKKFVFIDVYDGLSFHKIPVVLPADLKPKELNMHTSIDVSGVLAEAPNNSSILELHPNSELKVLGPCDQNAYPLAGKSKYTPEHIRQFLHLRYKTQKFGSILRIRSAATKAIHDYFNEKEFVQIHTPIVTSNDCEGAGETFTLRPDSEALLREMVNENKLKDPNIRFSQDELFFNKKVHLSVSSQLHLESAVSGLDKVWTFSPVFRAENNQSTRHLSEFYMLEAEIAFAYTIEDILEVIEDLVKSCIRHVLENNTQDWITACENNDSLKDLLETIIKNPFTVITFDEAKKLLKSKASDVVDEKGLNREQELLLTEKINNGVPVFVIDWPSSTKPFYMRQCDYDSSKVSAVDLLVPSIGELCGGSLREANLDLLTAAINREDPTGALLQSLSWYLDLRKYGGVPSGGFGLGFDRLIQLITGIKTIKDVSPFPRWAHHCPM